MAEEKKQPARKPAAKKTTSRKPAAAKTTRSRKPKVTAVTGEQIAERAYYIWADGSGAGAFDDWLRAERELTTA
jgi:DUF2934 family protein